jgi:hypothetical protein
MATRKPRLPPGIVPHPRYGCAPIASGIDIPHDTLRRGYWRHQGERMFPESALLADPTRQNYTVIPRSCYVDVLRDCRTCRRPFIFFAREQRYWFETLRFYVDADCVHCPDCRRQSRALQRRLRRYSDLRRRIRPTPAELRSLVDDATYLLVHGVLRDLSTLGRLKNRALEAIPEYAGTQRLGDAIAAARAVGERRARDKRVP